MIQYNLVNMTPEMLAKVAEQVAQWTTIPGAVVKYGTTTVEALKLERSVVLLSTWVDDNKDIHKKVCYSDNWHAAELVNMAVAHGELTVELPK